MLTNRAPENGGSRVNPFVALVRRIEIGEQCAIDALWHGTQQRLAAYLAHQFGMIRRRVENEETLASDVFLELYRQIGDGWLTTVTTDRHFWAIAIRIAKRRFADLRRSDNAAKHGGDVRTVPVEALDCFPDANAVSEAEFEIEEEVRETIDRLHDDGVLEIYKLIIKHYTRQEIAGALHISNDKVDRRLKKLCNALRARATGTNCDLADSAKATFSARYSVEPSQSDPEKTREKTRRNMGRNMGEKHGGETWGHPGL